MVTGKSMEVAQKIVDLLNQNVETGKFWLSRKERAW